MPQEHRASSAKPVRTRGASLCATLSKQPTEASLKQTTVERNERKPPEILRRRPHRGFRESRGTHHTHVIDNTNPPLVAERVFHRGRDSVQASREAEIGEDLAQRRGLRALRRELAPG